MSTRTTNKKPVGSVAFIGAGPGDPELLTIRAVEALKRADVVVVDQDASRAALVTHAASDVEVIDASCGQDGQPLTHAARAKLVTSAAKKGGYVVRLMDGDPALFHGFAVASGTSSNSTSIRGTSPIVGIL